YSQGIFPWPVSKEYPLCWFSPDPRGVIELSEVHLPKSLAKTIKKIDADTDFEFKMNTNFKAVINECAIAKRKGQADTWITDELLEGYSKLHHAGFAYSMEAYYKNELVAGVYGVNIGDFWSGESMFQKKTDLSKACLIKLLQFLRDKGIKYLDTQMVTSIVKSLGGKEIPRKDFIHYISNL
ncbi:MAG: leucyl/phenylalanyl-tRNA--protein transferase, partial [Thermoproteota archaeon]